jgi:hypothetical protein
MTNVSRLNVRRGQKLSVRREVTVELPEFAIRALQHRAEVANEGDPLHHEFVTFNDVIEWYVLSPLSVKELPHLEEAVPGFTAAFTKWLFEATYEPPD